MTPPIMKKFTHIVYYKYQQRSLLAKMSIDPKFVELTADVLEIFLQNILVQVLMIKGWIMMFILYEYS